MQCVYIGIGIAKGNMAEGKRFFERKAACRFKGHERSLWGDLSELCKAIHGHGPHGPHSYEAGQRAVDHGKNTPARQHNHGKNASHLFHGGVFNADQYPHSEWDGQKTYAFQYPGRDRRGYAQKRLAGQTLLTGRGPAFKKNLLPVVNQDFPYSVQGIGAHPLLVCHQLRQSCTAGIQFPFDALIDCN